MQQPRPASAVAAAQRRSTGAAVAAAGRRRPSGFQRIGGRRFARNDTSAHLYLSARL